MGIIKDVFDANIQLDSKSVLTERSYEFSNIEEIKKFLIKCINGYITDSEYLNFVRIELYDKKSRSYTITAKEINDVIRVHVTHVSDYDSNSYDQYIRVFNWNREFRDFIGEEFSKYLKSVSIRGFNRLGIEIRNRNGQNLILDIISSKEYSRIF